MRALIVGAAAVCALALGWPAAATAAEAVDPVAPTTTLPKLTVDERAPQVAVDLERTSAELADVTRRLDLARQKVQSAQQAVDVTDGFLATTRIAVDDVRSTLRANARNAYQRHDDAVDASFSIHRVESVARGERYLGDAQDVSTDTLRQLEEQQDATRTAREQRVAERDSAASQAADLSAAAEQLRVAQQRAIDSLNAWGAVTVMGDAQLTADQLAGWYRSTGQQPKLAPGTSIEDLARFYIEEGEAEHVRGDIAFAQAVIESASFSVAAGNNYSGIGVCDSCQGGYGFDSPRAGVRAQIQLLRNYADPDSRAANLAYDPVKGLYPDDREKAARVYDSFFLKGKAPLWNQMGNGNWATDPTYATKVVNLYVRMLAATVGVGS